MSDWVSKNGIEYPTATPTGEAGLRLKNNFEILADRALTSICSGRLTLQSGVAAPASDQTGKTTIYFMPFRGNEIALYDGAIWGLHKFSQLSASIPVTKFMTFDIFLYDDDGELALEITPWEASQVTGSITGGTNASPIVITSAGHGLANGDMVGIDGMVGNTAANGMMWTVANATTNTFSLEGSTGNGTYSSGGVWYKNPSSRAVDVNSVDGVWVKSGDTTFRYLGACRTTDIAGECEDSETKRFLCNAHNCVRRTVRVSDPAAEWTYSSDVYRPANAGGGNNFNRIEAVFALDPHPIDIACLGRQRPSIASSPGNGIGLDSAVNNSYSAGGPCVIPTSSHYGVSISMLRRLVGEGYHYFQWVERRGVSGSSVFSGTEGPRYKFGLIGFIEA